MINFAGRHNRMLAIDEIFSRSPVTPGGALHLPRRCRCASLAEPRTKMALLLIALSATDAP